MQETSVVGSKVYRERNGVRSSPGNGRLSGVIRDRGHSEGGEWMESRLKPKDFVARLVRMSHHGNPSLIVLSHGCDTSHQHL
jgi:hypothetical protein